MSKMTPEEIIGSLRSCAGFVKERGYDACAAVMRIAANEIELRERFFICKYTNDGTFTLRYNEDSGEWEEHKVYMSIDCATEDDFNFLKDCADKQHALPPSEKEDGPGMSSLACPSCGNSVNRRIKPPYCMMCGQKILWDDSSK